MKNNSSLIYNFFLVVGDVLALVLAFVGAYLIRAHVNAAPVAHTVHIKMYLDVFVALLPFWIILFALIGLYNSTIYEKRFNELGLLLIGSFIGMLFVVFWNFLSLTPILPSKLVPIYGFGLAFVFLVIFRNLARLIRTRLFTYKIGLNRVLIIGNTVMSGELVNSLFNSRRSGYEVLAVVGGKQATAQHPGVSLYNRFREAIEKINAPINTIVQTELYADEARNREILEYAQTNHIAYRFVPGNTELFVGNIDVELFRNSVPVIAVHQTALIGWGQIVKRSFDLLVGGILLIIASPFMLIIALIIKLTSRGPVFFRQVRLTRFNDEFRVFKFRTQYSQFGKGTPEEDFALLDRPDLAKEFRANGNFLASDPRVTALGKFLRKTSLDELGQLLNVINGDLSLVGPRALIPKDLATYGKRHTILSVKSGITGLAQVSGRNNIPAEERRKLDMYYVQNWTFWLDLIILAKTIRVILEGS
jgi:exopolysaccharide biosynthesis polyprenyl glycosylphosphotransferase